MSSIAVAGEYQGTFSEDMFDEGQKLPSPYHRTKYESERIVREQATCPWRVYRPAIVVGDSQTGEMDKIDGPYYFFKVIQRLRQLLPRVDAARRASSAATPTSCRSTSSSTRSTTSRTSRTSTASAFHLTDPTPQRVGDVLNMFAHGRARAADDACASTTPR